MIFLYLYLAENFEKITPEEEREREFNQQRAKMKEIYLSKEKECMQLKQKILQLKKDLDEASSQIVIAEYNREKDMERYEQETQTLNQIIQETCDESTIAHNEIKRLQDDNERIRMDMTSLRESFIQQQQVCVYIIIIPYFCSFIIDCLFVDVCFEGIKKFRRYPWT